MTCLFCAIITGDVPGHVVFQNQHVLAFLSLEAHPLIAPVKHLASHGDLDDQTSDAIFQATTKFAHAMRSETGCDGINLVLSDGRAAGQDVFHSHMHVKPRWNGDTVTLTWDTAPAPDAERSALADGLNPHKITLQVGE